MQIHVIILNKEGDILIAGILVEITNDSVDRIFDYQIPSSLKKHIKVGGRVLVPFGPRKLEGFVLEIKDKSDANNLKDIISVVEEEIVLNKELLLLGKKMKELTLSSLMSCYQVMLPKALKAKASSAIHRKYTTYYHLVKVPTKMTPAQEKIIHLLENGDVSSKELKEISVSGINTLFKNGYIKKLEKEVYRYQAKEEELVRYSLNDEQQKVVDTVLLKRNESSPFLLYGVTGSGKTEVYMELIQDALNRNKTSIVLVPEISLTPQMISRFTKRFGNNIAVLHSALNEGERYDEWRKIYRGEVKIVVGARSAIFAPLSNIGIIILDEEHSPNYKQEDANPKYSAVDIALLRSKYHSCPVIMGSATPSLMSFAKAKKNVYTLLTLMNRANKQALPEVSVVNMAKERGIISKSLDTAIRNRLDKKEQILLLLNRRGYSSFISCQSCGEVIKCPHCDITLTYHKSSNVLRCHYCGYGTKVMEKCPKCGENSLNNLGTGTEKVEEMLHIMYPTARILRMDFDTTSQKGKHQQLIEMFQNHEADILLGTQMIAKGLDFPLVSLVGVINADTSLNIPLFTASESTFQLLNQVGGRAGRASIKGNVIIQTYNPEHFAIECAKNHDYLHFFQMEMNYRKISKYPPYYYLTSIKILSKDFKKCEEESRKIKSYLDKNLKNSIILGPAPCSVLRVNNVYRFGITLKYKNEPNLYSVLQKLKDHYKNVYNLKIDVDFNCNSL